MHKAELFEIFVIDDTVDNLKLFARILQSSGYAVRKATNGEMGLRAIQKKKPHLILLDVRMPGMNGFEVCKELKSDAETRDIPVIFISASAEFSERDRCSKVGGVGYLPKPFKFDELLSTIAQHLPDSPKKQED